MEPTKSIGKREPSGTSGQGKLEETTTYNIKGKTFIVEPIFKKDSQDTVGTILMRLMQSDGEKH